MSISIVENRDCLEAMKEFTDKFFDLAIVDPPYGIDITNSGRLKKYNTTNADWDNEPPNDDYFKELFRMSKNQVIWGGNYFHLPPTKCFLIWDKRQPEDVSFASCEFAWTSFDSVAKTFYMSPLHTGEYRIHTTQKPVALYQWILSKYAKQGDKILDTHLGSGSSRIACYNGGYDFWGYEIDKEYFEKQEQRFENHTAQLRMEF